MAVHYMPLTFHQSLHMRITHVHVHIQKYNEFIIQRLVRCMHACMLKKNLKVHARAHLKRTIRILSETTGSSFDPN